MRRALLLALAALPLAGFDCGGPDPVLDPRPPGASTLRVRGAVSEDLWCVLSANDYSLIDPTYTGFVLMLECVRGMGVPGAVVVVDLDNAPTPNVAFGWDSTGATPASNVSSGDASRMVLDAGGFPFDTHAASAPFGDAGTGRLSCTLTSIGPVLDAASGAVVVHGSLDATVPSTTGGGDVTFSATF
ncbi:MAG TPA: hypothetical protein VLT47_02675 [Anaeromyxobacteraceae bacterium]|nr:hypothetical protein [Anaeromyxobacteraceae bacterium]